MRRIPRAAARMALLASLAGGVSLGPSGAATAQPAADSAFSTLSVGVQGHAAAWSARFGEGWRTRPGLVASVEAPFYVGRAEVGALLQRHQGRGAAPPDFSSAYVFAGWGPRLRLPGGLAWQNTLTVGDFLMRFGEETRVYYRTENELAFGLRSTLRYGRTPGLSMEAGVMALHVFTAEPLRTGTFSFGLRYAFGTPAWLRRALR